MRPSSSLPWLIATWLAMAAACGDDGTSNDDAVAGTGGRAAAGASGGGGRAATGGSGGRAATGGQEQGGAQGGEAGTAAGHGGAAGYGEASGEAGRGGEGAGGSSGGGAAAAGGDGVAGAVDGGGAGHGGAAGGPSGECDVGQRTHGTFDEGGGSLALCGAVVTVPAGKLDARRAATLSVVEVPPGAPAWLDAAGPAFELEVEGDLPVDTGAPLYVVVPHAETTRYVYLYTYVADAWNYVEACTREPGQMGQEAWAEGVFVALVEKEDFPDNVTGLGAGTVSVDFQGATSTFDLDANAIETHAIFDANSEGRAVTLSATKEGPNSSLERLRIDFGIDGAGAATLVQVTYGSTAQVQGFWSYLPFHSGAAEVQLTSDDAGRLVGSVNAELTRGERVGAFVADFDVTVEKYRYPPEGYCNIPEGDTLQRASSASRRDERPRSQR